MSIHPTMTGAALQLLDGCALHHVTGDRDQVLSTLAGRVVEAGFALPSLPAAVLARENAYPTALPTPVPVAIPHTDPAHVLQPGLAVASLAEPVEFGLMGGSAERLAVRLVVLLCVSDPAGQVGGLQQVLDRLGDAQAVRTLVNHDDPGTFETAVREWLAT
ncbi:MAG: PTS sugar transporter subunit IIA [Micropruina sp.]|nr:PTS sugar transporter subunit IIA [Micropruina sp.]